MTELKTVNKDTNIVSDLRSFFTGNDNNRAINRIMGFMKHINIHPIPLVAEKRENCKFTNRHVLTLLILMQIFLVRNASQYAGSALYNLFVCEKDMFYRFHNTLQGNLCSVRSVMRGGGESCGFGIFWDTLQSGIAQNAVLAARWYKWPGGIAVCYVAR